MKTETTNQTKKTPISALKSSTSGVFQDLSANEQKALDAINLEIQALGRHTTEAAFALGRHFAEAKTILPEKAFGVWLKSVSKYTVRTAWNYISVHEKLAEYSDRLVALGTSATMLFELAKAEPADALAVIQRLEAGEDLTVAKVKKALFGEQPKKLQSNNLDRPGFAGVANLATIRANIDFDNFQKEMNFISTVVEAAVADAKANKRVIISGFSNEIQLPSRRALELLESLIAPLEMDATDARRRMGHKKLDQAASWERCRAVLDLMGRSDDWPGKNEFKGWLLNEIYPVVRFIVNSEPMPLLMDESSVVKFRSGEAAEVDVNNEAKSARTSSAVISEAA